MAMTYEGDLSGQGLRIGLVVARFNALVSDRLREGAADALRRHGVADADITVVVVPGSFEIPQAARTLARSGEHDAVVCLGAVIRGETSHFEFVAEAAARGIAQAAFEGQVPVVFGVLTTDSVDQALDRAGGKHGNKGAEAAASAIEMANLHRQLRK